MKTTAFKLAFLVLTICLWFSPSSYAQSNPDSHFVTAAGTDENSLAWDGISQSADNGKTVITGYYSPDTITIGQFKTLEVKTSYAIFPNPSSGKTKLKVQLKPGDSKLMLYDLTGRILSEISVEPDQDFAEINVMSLYKGIYILKVLAGESVAGIEKIVVN